MHRIVAVILGIAIVPALASAQQSLPATAPTALGTLAPVALPQNNVQSNAIPAESMQAAQHRFTTMRALRMQASTAMLGALTPAHRTLLAQIVGALAISPDPDAAGAMRQIDAALSPREANAVVATERNFQSQMVTEMQRTMPMPMNATVSAMLGSEDAGQILLRNAAMAMLPMPMMSFGPGPVHP